MLSDPNIAPLIIETTNAYSEALKKGIEKRDIPADMLRMLQENTFIFSGFKTHAELSEISALLMENGKLKSFERFKQDVKAIDRDYNTNYLRAEYNFAVSSSRSAAMWADLSKDSDKYYLQYRTAKDERVRAEHATLDEITLPADDPFWKDYFPPNGWNCRCTVVKVRRSKYTESNSGEAIKRGIKATTKINKKGQNKAAIFRFNPGIEHAIFPPRHPYYKVPKQEKQAINTSLDNIQSNDNPHPALKKNYTTNEQVNETFKLINKELTDKWFENNDLDLQITTDPSVNGSTNGNGIINLKPDRLNNVKIALGKIANKQSTTITYNEADAMATFWHEITHNRHKKLDSAGSRYSYSRKCMELANEWIARNTLKDFYSTLGCAEMPHKVLTVSRTSTGYNDMVCNYEYVIAKLHLDKDKAFDTVKSYLFNQNYAKQLEGLTDGLLDAGIKIQKGDIIKSPTRTEIKNLIKKIAYCSDDIDYDLTHKYEFYDDSLTRAQKINKYLKDLGFVDLKKQTEKEGLNQ